MGEKVNCPACDQEVDISSINRHLDSGCKAEDPPPAASSDSSKPIASIFQTPASKRQHLPKPAPTPTKQLSLSTPTASSPVAPTLPSPTLKQKRTLVIDADDEPAYQPYSSEPMAKKQRPASNALQAAMPLAERMRPQTLDDVYGQELVGRTGVLRGLIEEGRVPSMIFWGPAGCGKTTLAKLIARTSGAIIKEISATASGVAECKDIFKQAKNSLVMTGTKTILFCDEIHRFSKAQQDCFLAPVESGVITLIGATTENPSFKVQSALLSRCRVFTLSPLTPQSISVILERAIEATVTTRHPLLTDSFVSYLSRISSGDARCALNLLELSLSLLSRPATTLETLKSSLTRTLLYDRAGDAHFDTISAFHKSVRGSDPDAALFYLARMLKGGEDPLYIARRMVIIASEDVGLADNTMLPLAIAAHTAVQQVGLPEARINLAHCATALALAKKSTRAYRGLGAAMNCLEEEPEAAAAHIPVHLRNAPTKLMKELGYGKKYKYNPDFVDGKVKQEYLPDVLRGRTFLEERDLGTSVDPELEGEEAMGT